VLSDCDFGSGNESYESSITAGVVGVSSPASSNGSWKGTGTGTGKEGDGFPAGGTGGTTCGFSSDDVTANTRSAGSGGFTGGGGDRAAGAGAGVEAVAWCTDPAASPVVKFATSDCRSAASASCSCLRTSTYIVTEDIS